MQVVSEGNKLEDRIQYDMNKVIDVANNFGIVFVNLKSRDSAHESLASIDRMMVQISSSRAELGSMSNRMNSVIQNLQVGRENLSSSNSKIRDTDVALETGKRITSQMAEAASSSMLKMSNDQPGIILKLLA